MATSPIAPTITHRRVANPPLWLIVLTGEHDLSTSRDVERVLHQAVAGGEPVVVDMQETTFADSSILSVILRAGQQAGRRELAVVLPGDGEVTRLFDLVDASAIIQLSRHGAAPSGGATR